MATTAVSSKYDGLFRKYAGRVPVPYLRALSQRESGMNPTAGAGGTGALGLMQITKVVLDGYNARHGTQITRAQLVDPEVSVRLGADLLNTIVAAYAQHRDPNLRNGDWGNADFVKLVTAGWNSGYSEGGGVGKVADYLEARGEPVTHDAVFANAAAAGATRFLQDPAKQRWQAGVASLYFAQPDRVLGRVGGSALPLLALLLVGGWGLHRLLS